MDDNKVITLSNLYYYKMIFFSFLHNTIGRSIYAREECQEVLRPIVCLTGLHLFELNCVTRRNTAIWVNI